jgi:hypothetical protein
LPSDSKNITIFDKESYLSPLSGTRKISIKPNYFSSFVSYPRIDPKDRDRIKSGAEDFTPSIVFDPVKHDYVSGPLVRCRCSVCHDILLDYYNVYTKEYNFNLDKCPRCLNLLNNKPRPDLSKKARNRIQLSFDWMYLLSKQKKAYNEKLKKWYTFKLALLTVKLPCKQLHDDLFIKNKIMNTFFQHLRAKYKLHFYLWHAEKGKDEIFHCHILHDHFIGAIEINKYWNNLISKYGYIEQYRLNQQAFHKDGFKLNLKHLPRWHKSAQLKAYKKGIASGWSCPTGTSDIHSIHKVRNTRAYLAKYISKPPDVSKEVAAKAATEAKKRGLETLEAEDVEAIRIQEIKKHYVGGHCWFVSQALSALKGAVCDITPEIVDLFKKVAKIAAPKIYLGEWAELFHFNIKSIIVKNFTPLIDIIRNFITQVRASNPHYNINIFSTLGIPLTLFS